MRLAFCTDSARRRGFFALVEDNSRIGGGWALQKKRSCKRTAAELILKAAALRLRRAVKRRSRGLVSSALDESNRVYSRSNAHRIYTAFF